MMPPQLTDKELKRATGELKSFLRIPSVSTLPEHAGAMGAAAVFLRDKLKAAGMDAEVLETAGHPVVFAERAASPEAPTVLVYGHYDVQPPDPVDLWESDPFEPLLVDDYIVARGASDDKGQVYAHVKGVERLLRNGSKPAVNIKFLVEGEEEIGSPSLESFIRANLDRLAADVVVISDGAMVAPGVPTITYGLKGLCYLELRLRTAAMDLHSGAFGGAVPNPIHVLARIVSALHDESGRVTVPGFYDRVMPLSEEERVAFRRVPFDEQEFAEEIGITGTPGESGYTVLERLWARPTLDVNGIGGGFQGEGAKTVIPAEAFAKISCRLVPDQSSSEIRDKLTRHLHDLAPDGATVYVIDLHGGEPALTPLDSPAVQAAGDALQRIYGRAPVFTRTGGTIPVVSTFQKLLGADVVLVGFGLENDRIHSPNERFSLANYAQGIVTSEALFESLAHLND